MEERQMIREIREQAEEEDTPVLKERIKPRRARADGAADKVKSLTKKERSVRYKDLIE